MIIQFINVFIVITVFVLHCMCMGIGKNQGRTPQSGKSIGSSSSGIGQRVGQEFRCAGDNLYYRGRQTGSRGLLPRVREDLVNRVLATVKSSNELAEHMILAIRDGTLDLAIARQLDETRELAETRVITTTTTEVPDVREVVPEVVPVYLEQSGEFAILDDAVANETIGTEMIRPVFNEGRRPIENKFAKQIVVPVVTLSSEEESSEDNNERRSRRRCFYNRLLEDVSRIDGPVGTAADFLRAYEYNTNRRRRRNRINVTPSGR